MKPPVAGLPLSRRRSPVLLHQPQNVFPLVGCRTPDEFAQNLRALDVQLSNAQLDWLDLKTGVR